MGYDYNFEKHLARSFKGIKPSSSGSSKKRKASTKGDDIMNEDEDKKGDESKPHDPPLFKRHRVAKGKASHIKYDWSDATYHDDSRDEDYRPR